MRVFYDLAHPQQRASALMILLPGALQDPQEFRHEGFTDALRRHEPEFDVALVDLEIDFIGDALNGKALQALHETVVGPAREQYERIWMTGISIGGFLALSHAACYPNLLDGICLLAPYPGTRVQEGSNETAGNEDMESRVRHWLRTRPESSPPRWLGSLWLGYGRQDRFADGLQQMAKWLPQDCIETVEGGHDWAAWRSLWHSFLCNNLARRIERKRK